jgi:putative DNA primase/helicase
MTIAFDPPLVLANFPESLRAARRWLLWRLEDRPGDQPTKVPYALDGNRASTTDASCWGTLDAVLHFQAERGFSGVGYVFSGDGVVGIDLDHRRDAATGEIAPWALAILDPLRSYAEVSPSGAGIHVFAGGTLPGRGRKRRIRSADASPDAAIEVYDRARYFTVTGARLQDYPATVEPRQEAIDALYAQFDQPAAGAPASAPPSSSLSDGELLDHARAARNGAAFERLWRGDSSGHDGDDSAADLALCAHLAFWCGRDPARIDRLFRQSGLFREKWERADYREGTIAKALAGRREFFGAPRSGTAEAAGTDQTGATGERPVIVVEHDDVATVDAAEEALAAADAGVYQQRDQMVRIARGRDAPNRRLRELADPEGPIVAPIPLASIREQLSAAAVWQRWVEGKEGPVLKRIDPPLRIAEMLAARGQWTSFPVLRGVAESPTLLPDGRILEEPGLDEASGIFLRLQEEFPRVPATPTRDDAIAALDRLADPLCDFPFVRPCHRSAAVATMICGVARWSIPGPTPMVFIDSPIRGAGKGKLGKVLLVPMLGRIATMSFELASATETRKSLFALALGGGLYVFVDNVEGVFGDGVCPQHAEMRLRSLVAVVHRVEQFRVPRSKLRQDLRVPPVVLLRRVPDRAQPPCVGHDDLVSEARDDTAHPRGVRTALHHHARPPKSTEELLHVLACRPEFALAHDLPCAPVDHAELERAVTQVHPDHETCTLRHGWSPWAGARWK